MSNLQLRKAERKQVKLRIGLTAPSGGGKTYSALKMARGMATAWEKIAVIDTEQGSAELYSHFGPYNVLTLTPPFSPERYIEAIKACEDAGVEVIVIDSVTHEWDGKGGCLEIVDQLGGRYQDWGKVTPRHRKFLDALLSSTCHILTTTRRKQDYEMEKDNNGKITVQKVGMKEIQREGYEYELTVNFEMDIRHNAIAAKDRTGLFMDKPAFLISEEVGKILKDWCESGKANPVEQKREIMRQLKRLGYQTATKEQIEAAITEVAAMELKEENYQPIIEKLAMAEPKPKDDKPQDPPAPLQPVVESKTAEPELTPEQIAAEQQKKAEEAKAARAAAEKASPSQLTVLKSLLHQKEGIAQDDDKNILGYLGLVHDINIESLAELTKEEFSKLHKALLAQASKQ